MDDVIPSHIEGAAHALALDAATAEAVTALEPQGISPVLIKGPATAHWLYADAPDVRNYVDIDILVDPDRFRDAEDVLESLGYQSEYGDYRVANQAWLHSSAWERPGPSPSYIDVHRGFHGVSDWPAWWAVMSSHTIEIDVAGRPVRIPDAPGCALIVALHDAATGRSERSAADLRRAIDTFDDAIWHEAVQRASQVGCQPSVVAALMLHDAGERLADRLGLPAAIPPDVAIRTLVASGVAPGLADRAWVLQTQLAAASTWRERIRVMRDVVVPSREFLQISRPLARQGRMGMLATRMIRPFDVALRAPRIIWLVARGRRRARRSGWHD